jgi:hypothetical protein
MTSAIFDQSNRGARGPGPSDGIQPSLTSPDRAKGDSMITLEGIGRNLIKVHDMSEGKERNARMSALKYMIGICEFLNGSRKDLDQVIVYDNMVKDVAKAAMDSIGRLDRFDGFQITKKESTTLANAIEQEFGLTGLDMSDMAVRIVEHWKYWGFIK